VGCRRIAETNNIWTKSLSRPSAALVRRDALMTAVKPIPKLTDGRTFALAGTALGVRSK
jgi:hypothetical protein